MPVRSVVVLGLILSGGAVVGLATVVDAQLDSPSNESCADLRVAGAGGAFRRWVVSTDSADVTNQECSNSGGVTDFGSGSSFTIYCGESTSGAVPPTAADTLRVSLVVDNTGFGSDNPTSVRQMTPSGNSCAENPESFTVYCTDTGLVGGSARYGTIRLHIFAEETTPVTGYSVNSDEGAAIQDQWGIYRCTLETGNIYQSNSQSVYIAGDTIGTAFFAAAASYEAVNNGNAWVTCNSVSYNLGAGRPSTTNQSLTTTVIGSLNVWLTTCTNLDWGFDFTRTSQVSGFAGTLYGKFTNPASGTSVDGDASNLSRSSTSSLSRVISAAACEYHVNATAGTVSIFNRMEGVRSHCHVAAWQNARGGNIGSGVFARGFLSRTNLPDTVDYSATDFTTSGSGFSEWTRASAIGASAGTYHGLVQTFSTSGRTEGVLLSVGNQSETFVLSTFHNATNVFAAKSSGGANVSSFIIGSDLEFQSVRGLKNARGELLQSVPVSCVRTVPGNGNQASVSMGLTDASGNTAWVQFDVEPPAGNWVTTCSSESAGNAMSYAIMYAHTSAFTADTNIVVMPWLKANVTCELVLNVTASAEFWVNNTFGSSYIVPDDGFWVKVDQNPIDSPTLVNVLWGPYRMNTTHGDRLAHSQICLTDDADFDINVVDHPLHVHVAANLTGRVFLSTESIQQDPFTVVTSLNIEFPALIDFASLALWIVIGYFSVERGIWFVAIAPFAEVFNIALDGAGVGRMWGEQFSILLLVTGATMHFFFIVLPRILQGKGK